MQKSIINISLWFCLVICFGACNSQEDKKATESTPKDSAATVAAQPEKVLITRNDCEGVGNLTVSEDTAYVMMKTYDSIYRKAGTANERTNLTKSAWIDGMVIGSLADFLESAQGSNYDGVRFMNTATASNRESSVHMVPTKKDPTGANVNKHTNDWGPGKFSLRSGETIKFRNFNTADNIASTLMGNFDRFYRTETSIPLNKNPLSSGVWISKCVFLSLRDLIDTPDENLDGIRIFMGAYNHFIIPEIPGQFNQFQSTIILVPTSPGNGVDIHNERWDVIKVRTNWNKDAGYNHGALCPQICN